MALPPRERLIRYLVDAGARYWPGLSGEAVLAVAPRPIGAEGPFHGRWERVELPAWAADLGVGTPPAILVDSGTVVPGSGPPCERCDWWTAAFLALSGLAEVEHERRHGPVHSYAFRLRTIDPALFDHAWVNRIMLYLRRMAARAAERDEADLFGDLPAAEIDLTHDVDAFGKTAAIRIKQTAFETFAAVRRLGRGKLGGAVRKTRDAARFAFTSPDYALIDTVREIEASAGLRSTFHFFACPANRRRTAREWLFDPAYVLEQGPVAAAVRDLLERDFDIGLHPSFESWRNPDRIRREREHLQSVAGAEITRCRQHWLRFSWHRTWTAQRAAGIRLDSTLGFNDRSGFRCAAALRFAPWDAHTMAPHDLEVIPLVVMDSHLYSTVEYDRDQRAEQIARFVGEIRAVHGTASLLWHPHTLAPDYGWSEGFRDMVEICRAR